MINVSAKTLQSKATHLVIHGPGERVGCFHVECGEGVLPADHRHDEEDLEEGETLCHGESPGRRGVVLPFHRQARVFLVHDVDKLIVHLPVASGIAGKTNENTNEKRFKFILEQGWGIFGALR